jgi:hypothetical protein
MLRSRFALCLTMRIGLVVIVADSVGANGPHNVADFRLIPMVEKNIPEKAQS